MQEDRTAIARQAIRAALAGGSDGYQPEQLGPWWDVYAELVRTPLDDRARVFAVLDHEGQVTRLLAADSANTAHTATDSWGRVVPFDEHQLPPFPVEALPSWLHAIVVAESHAKQTPIDLAAMLALSVLSTARVRRVVDQPRPGWIEPINLFTVVALPPGSCKSPVFTTMTAPLVRWEARKTAELIEEIAVREAQRRVLEEQLRRAEGEAAKASNRDAQLAARADVDTLARELAAFVVPSLPRLIVDDITPEVLGTMLNQQDGRIAVLSPEGDIFNIMAGRYSQGGPNLAIYLKAYSGDTIRIDRRTRTEHVERPALTLGLTVQPDVLQSLGQKREFRGLGLLGRFLYAIPVSLVGVREVAPPAVPADVLDNYAAQVTCLLDAYGPDNSANTANTSLKNDSGSSPVLLEYSAAAQAAQIAFERWLEPQLGQGGNLEPIVDWAAKLAGTVVRLTGLLHLASEAADTLVAEATVAAAISIARYAIPHAHAAYATIGADPSVEAAKHLVAWIDRSGRSTFSRRDAFEGTKGRFKKVADLDPALELLADQGYIRPREPEERAGPGRKPSPSYDVHPALGAVHNSHNSHNRLHTSGGAAGAGELSLAQFAQCAEQAATP
jgi:replicative DNA helicase